MKTVTDIASRRLEKANVRMAALRRASAGWETMLVPIIGTVEPKVIPYGTELLTVLHTIVDESQPKGYLAATYWCDKKVEQLSSVVAACKDQGERWRQFLQSSEESALSEWPQKVLDMEKAIAAIKVDYHKRLEKKSDKLREEHQKKMRKRDVDTLGMGCLGLLAGGALFVLAIIVRQFIFSDFSQAFERSTLMAEVKRAMDREGVIGFIKLIPATVNRWDTLEFWWLIGHAFCAYAWAILPITIFVLATLKHIKQMMKLNGVVKFAEEESNTAMLEALEDKGVELTYLQKSIAEHLPTNRVHVAAKQQMKELLDVLNSVEEQLLDHRRQPGE